MAESVVEIEVEIRNAEGLHMRPAMEFVDLAGRFSSSITVRANDLSADAKSIMQMTMLAATCGTRIQIRAEGSDAAEAIESLRQLVEEKFADSSADSSESSKQEG